MKFFLKTKKIILTPPIIIGLFLLLGAGITLGTIYLGGSGRTDEINLQKGLVGHWTLDGNAKDSTPYGNNGTIYEASSTADRKGQSGKALSFDGSNDYVTMGTAGASLQITGAITLEGWVKIDDLTTSPQFFGRGLTGGSNGNYGYAVAFYGVNRNVYFDTYSTTTRDQLNTPTATITDNNWHHIVCTWDGTTNLYGKNIYIDTILKATKASTITAMGTPNYPFTIGVRGTLTSMFMKGNIDEVRIYNRALSAAEIKALYESYDPAPRISDLQKGLVGYWTLDGNAKDSTPYSNHGTIYQASSTADRKGKANGALSFDGLNDYVKIEPNDSLNLNEGGTLAGWIYFKDWNGLASYQYVFHKGSSYSWIGSQYMFVRQGNNQYLDFSVSNGTSYRHFRATDTLSLNTWYYIAATWTATDKICYVNGVYFSSVASTVMPSSTAQPFRIGNTTSDYPFNGTIDEVRIYNRALSAEEIKALYESYDPAPRISDLQKGLVGYWTLDGHAKDSTPYGNNGTIYEASSTADREGQAGKALSFDGGNDYVDLGNKSIFDFGTGDFTIEAWVNTPGPLGAATVIAKTNFLGDEDGWHIYQSGYYRFTIGNGTTRIIVDTAVLSYNTWHHIVCLRGGNYLKVYVDGSYYAQTSGAAININSSAYNAVIGEKLGYGWFNGLIDEVRIYNRALSADEIKQLYESYQ